MRANFMKMALEKEFVGKEFNGGANSVSPYSVGYFIREKLIPAHAKHDITVSVDKYCVTLSVTYKTADRWVQRSLLHADIRRAKGVSHYNFFGSYCDWTIKGIDVTFCDNGQNLDLNDLYEKLMNEADQQKINALEYEAEILDILNDLKAKTGLDEHKLRDCIDYIHNHWYSLANKIK